MLLRPSTKRWVSGDDKYLAEYIALRCPGETDPGRQGRRIYRDLLDSTEVCWRFTFVPPPHFILLTQYSLTSIGGPEDTVLNN